MSSFLKSILSSGLVKARVLKMLHAASLAAGTWALTSTYVWITTHLMAVSQADAMAIAGTVSAAVAGGILAVGSAVFDAWVDPGVVHDKITTAAATGSVAAADNPTVRQAVKDASGSPEALKEVLATLAAGKE